ncbi:type I-E CRISPR-associated protein Cas7/Cse4/CasC [Filifactor alocis]|uniref:type I-E CRISPR-associated protein Cas7/Cse4/CasC n=1 Tax=Filifactor alocis TaxID=143361 RepID=UPI003C6EADBC
MSKNLFLDIHVLQTVPPSNINRDDTGSPKTAQYGGVTRTRVSSQSWKKAIRDYFLENGSSSNVGIRSKNIPEYIAAEIRKIDGSISEEDSLKMSCSILEAGGIKLSDNKMKALFFLGCKQAENLAKKAIEGSKEKKEIQMILNQYLAIDIALFGRMVADDPTLNTDASCQVAHAISTHAVQTEFDFFTAVDDLAPEDNAGAGMLGTVEFNSSTLYRYANVAIHEFNRQLDGRKEEVINSLKLFIKAFVESMPTGKVNTFANQTVPQVLMINLRTDRPVSLVSAFEKPVKHRDGYVKESAERLFEELKKVEKFVDKPVLTLSVSLEDMQSGEDVKIENSIRELVEDLGTYLVTAL